MKTKTFVLVVVAFLALAGVAQSAMWVGAQLGGNFPLKSNVDVNGVTFGDTTFRPSVIGGGTIGYDFINTGFGAYNWPDWMKYLSVATDLTYNRMVVEGQSGGLGDALANSARFNGYMVAWSFLLRAQYGFMHDNEVPSGRVVPYIGVGPAVVFSGGDGSYALVSVNNLTNTRFHVAQTNIGVVVEPGIRFMCLKNVSVDTAMRYRWCRPSWSGDDVNIKVPLNQLSFLVRANYHF